MKKIELRRMNRKVGGFPLIAALSLPLLAGCTSVGPNTATVMKAPTESAVQGIQIVEMTETIARRIQAQPAPGFAETLGQAEAVGGKVYPGDTLEISIWEAPPAALFSNNASNAAYMAEGIQNLTTSRSTQLPELLVGPDGTVTVPFAGRLTVNDRTPSQIEKEITARLRGKAHLPQVMVRLLRNATSTATVVGEVTNSTRVPLTPKGERLLDALAAAGGTRQPINKITVQISRGNIVQSMPLEAVIRDPRQNIVLKTDDVITAFYQPYSFTALGAAGKNEEVNFEATGLTLAQAIGRIGGLQDARADPKGMFLFRWEDPALVPELAQGVQARQDGRIPVIYRVNMKDPGTYFSMQNFAMRDKDVIFVSNSPTAELQRFISIIASTILPIATVDNLVTNN
ncbi:polysaccharide biosynthesis/export family protein [Sphingobium sp. AP49]|uniref:polysaccharide biosynthesis/export family protein n=1 Tax=Sphingobium sp. AP49 TaxID=1144307 RepID=UPI00026EDFDF|nr:polysaccharide biosynthesis/export family protein [Sphingobium sp. AP49]WHO39969.1 polysaccharide biosynthesis/export family protein [Sphingobium sp. AP49]